MRKAFVATLALLAAGSTAAARSSTLAMSCGEANAFVAAHGAVVLSTGTHTYDRFVATPGYCLLGEYAWPGMAPTRDGRCRLAFTCKPGRSPLEESLFD